ncbi:MAG: hypothetical protein KBH73_06060 [Syntrophobacterales bacterium]|nr:hypothetical protein [Syntrophobacterales bacterium]HNQ01140.1 hypothetical protein [Syntrophales bacterium]HNS53704.1 hypothetical protein [Syntrophales bacterium]
MTGDVKGSKTDFIAGLAVGDELDHGAKLLSRHIAGGNTGIRQGIIDAVRCPVDENRSPFGSIEKQRP